MHKPVWQLVFHFVSNHLIRSVLVTALKCNRIYQRCRFFCILYFCPPPHEVRKGGYWIRHRLSVRPSVRPFTTFQVRYVPFHVPCPRCCSLCEKHHYTIKAGDTRATRTLVISELPLSETWCRYTVRRRRLLRRSVYMSKTELLYARRDRGFCKTDLLK